MQLQLQLQPYMRQRFRPRSHGVNMSNFVRSNMRLSHRLCKFQPITSTSEMQHAMCELWTRLSNWSILSRIIRVVWQTDRKEYGPFAIAPDKEYGRKGSSYTEIPKVNKDFRETKINSWRNPSVKTKRWDTNLFLITTVGLIFIQNYCRESCRHILLLSLAACSTLQTCILNSH